MLQKTADLIRKTPWLLLLLGGVATLALLVLLGLPMQVIHLADSGDTLAERHAIQHTIRVAAGNRALDVAQGVVQNLRDRTTDAERQRELDRTLAEITHARGELAEAYTGLADAAHESARDAAEAAHEAAIDAAETALEAATDARTAIEDIRHEALEHLRDNGVDISSAMQSFDQMLTAARAKEESARASLATLRAQSYDTALDAPSQQPVPPVALPVAVTERIHTAVADDAQRVMLGVVLVLLAIPVLLALVVAKVFIDRAHRRSLAAAAPADSSLELASVTPVRTTGWRRVWQATRTVHGLWARLLGHSFVVLLVALAGVLLACLLALLVGWLPVHVGDLQVDGIEGLMIGSGGLLAGFSAIALAIATVLAVVYGLSLLFVGLAIFIPTVILLGMMPVLAPVVLMALGLWWVLTRNRRV